jgi:membrane glycosyltransferase
MQASQVALARLHEQVLSEGHAEWLGAWRASIKADPHAPLLPLQPQSSQAQPA